MVQESSTGIVRVAKAIGLIFLLLVVLPLGILSLFVCSAESFAGLELVSAVIDLIAALSGDSSNANGSGQGPKQT